MAQRTVVELIDDIDGDIAAETVEFSLDGVSYIIDLSPHNADKLRKGLAPYVDKARRAAASKTGRAVKAKIERSVGGRDRSADIRAWAKEHGIAVNDRGRIPAQVTAAYQADDPSKATVPATTSDLGKADEAGQAKAVPPRVPQATFRAVSNP